MALVADTFLRATHFLSLRERFLNTPWSRANAINVTVAKANRRCSLTYGETGERLNLSQAGKLLVVAQDGTKTAAVSDRVGRQWRHGG